MRRENEAMVERTKFKDFDAVQLKNEKGDELLVITDIGPRIIGFMPEGGDNFFYVNEEDLKKGKLDPKKWYIYGGTRLWISPESTLTYTPDNAAVRVTFDGKRVEFVSEVDETTKLRKIIEIEAKKETFTINFSVINEGSFLLTSGLWALSCLKSVPNAAIYLPWGEQSGWNVKDMKYWRSWIVSGTNIESKQWKPTNEFFTVHPSGELGKIGFANRYGFALFKSGNLSFIKKADYIESGVYPDDGCSFEIYTSKEFYEIESLSPLYCIKPGAKYSHREEWWAGYERIDTKSIEGVKSFVDSLF